MATLVHTKPCRSCPFRRTSAPGWLGEETDPEAFTRAALADYVDYDLPCHEAVDYDDPDWQRTQLLGAPACAGALVFAKNCAKHPRDPRRSAMVKAVEQDHDGVFSRPSEFHGHHERARTMSDV